MNAKDRPRCAIALPDGRADHRGAGMSWHCIYTEARAERLAQRRLEATGYETLYLHYAGTVSHARRTIGVLKPYFPRYLFAHVGEDQSVGQINRTHGVSSVVHAGDQPLKIPQDVIEDLKARGDRNGLVKLTEEEKQARKLLKSGQTVLVRDGLFTGYHGIVDLDSGTEILVWLEMFRGGRVKIGLRPEAVSPEVRSGP